MNNNYIKIQNPDIPSLIRDIENYPEGIVISIDKPYKWTSADVVRKLKFKLQRFFNKKNIKVGHAGTLDPLATGILLVCIGKATKQAEELQSHEKEYIASITFGATTPCYDLEKEIDAHFPYEHITEELIQSIIPTFIGEQDQIPPIFSAKLINGVRAYQYARAGEPVEMKAAKITIHEMEILSFESPILTIKIRCSKGTYIRSIARDFGLALTSGAHLSGLIRSRSGEFKIENALDITTAEKIFENIDQN